MIIPQPCYKENTLYQRWGKLAIYCYKRHCNCLNCFYSEFCKKSMSYNLYNIKPLKFSVLMLFARHGKPKEEL